ncbi:Trafficking protein particle complex subunit 5 [Savitreella phatthalungensis]
MSQPQADAQPQTQASIQADPLSQTQAQSQQQLTNEPRSLPATNHPNNTTSNPTSITSAIASAIPSIPTSLPSNPLPPLIRPAFPSNMRIGSGSLLGGSSRKPDIYARNLARTAKSEASLATMAFVFSALVQRAQKDVSGVPEFERRLSEHGRHIGRRCLELYTYRETSLRNRKRETRLLGIIQWIYTTLWRSLFGRTADSLEKSNTAADEYMLFDNAPILNTFVSVPKEMGGLSCSAFVAGIIEGVLTSGNFPCKVSAHSVGTDQIPDRTVFLIKLDPSVMEREEYLGA